MSFNLFGHRTLDFISSLKESFGYDYNSDADPASRGEDGSTVFGPASENLDSMTIKCKVGLGKSTVNVDFSGGSFAPAAEALRSFDPSGETDSQLSPAEVIARTIRVREKDGASYVTFKTSMAKNTRSCMVPIDHWSEFLAVISTAAQSVEGAVEYYRAGRLAAEEAARAAAQDNEG